jgi:hypothetical protein
MTDFSGIPFTPAAPEKRPYQQGSLASLGYYLNKPWEWLSRGAGKLAGVDLPESHTFWDQPTLADVIRKTAGASNADAGSNIAAAVADIGLAILLDPVNLIKVGGLTKLGRAAKAGNLADTVTKSSRSGFLKGVVAAAKEEGIAGRRLSKTIRKAGRAYDSTKELLSAYPKGIAPLGKSLKEQVQLGQRVVLGLDVEGHPALKAILNKLPFNTGKVTTEGINIPLLSEKAAEVASNLGALGKGALFGTAKVLNKVTGAIGPSLNLPTNTATVKIQGLLNDFQEATAIGKHRNTTTLVDRATRYAGSAEGARLVVRELEKTATDTSRVNLLEAVGELLDKNSVEINKRVFGSSAGRAVVEGVEGSGYIRELKKPSALFEGKDLKAREALINEAADSLKNKTALDTKFVSIPGSPRFTVSKGLLAVDGSLSSDVVKGLTRAEELPGVIRYQRVTTSEGASVLLGKVFSDTHISKPSAAHIENLDALAALWAKRGYTIQDADLTDFLFGSGGSVQVVNPSVIRRVKGKGSARLRRAMSQSRSAISKINRHSIDNLYIPHRLASTELTKSTSLADILVRDVSTVTTELSATSGVSSLVTNDVTASLANKAGLTHPETEAAAVEYVLAVQNSGSFHPVRARVDPRGRLIVYEGMERLRAAQLLDMKEVPVVLDQFTALDPRRANAAVNKLPLSIETREPFVSALRNRAGKPASAALEKLGLKPNGDTFLLDDTLKAVSSSNAVKNYKNNFGELLRSRLSDLVDPNESPFIRSAHTDALLTLERRLGSTGEFVEGVRGSFKWKRGGKSLTHRAATRFVQILDASETPEELLAAFQQFIRSDFVTPAWIARNFDNLKAAASDIKSALVESGLVGLSDDILSELKLAVKRVPDLTALHVDGEGNLILASSRKTVEELQDTLRTITKKLGKVSGAGVEVVLEGTDGSLRARLSEFVDEAFQFEPRPQGASTLLGIPQRENLEEGGIFIDKGLPSDRVPKVDKGVSKPLQVIGSAKGSDIKHWSPGVKSGFIDPTGSVVWSTSHHKPADIIEEVYGQGPLLVREIFSVHPEAGIVVSNLLGLDGSFTKLDTRAVRFIEDRLGKLARKFESIGFSKRTPLKVVSDLPPEVQKQFIPHLTVGMVADPEFTLNLPEAIKGYDMRDVAAVALDDFLKPSTGVVELDNLVSELRQQYSAELVAETMAGLPTRYREGYYARILGPEALLALDDLFEGWKKSGTVEATGLSSFWDHSPFKGRKYSTLTVEEINQVWSNLKGGPKKLLDYAKENRHPFLSTLASIDAANGDTALMEFFVGDPILASKVRSDIHITAMAQKHLWDRLVEDFAISSGTFEEVSQHLRPKKVLAELQDSLADVNQEIGKLKATLDSTDKNLLSAEIETRIKTLERKAQAIASDITEQVVEKVGRNGIPGSDIDMAGGIFMNRADAQRLLDNPDFPGITADSLLSSDAPFVYLQTDSVQALTGTGVQVSVFPREVVSYLRNHFALMNNTGGAFDQFLTKFFDPVQSMFKKLALFALPRATKFVTRNILSDSIRMWVAGVDPANVIESWKIMGGDVVDFLKGRDPALFNKLKSHVFIGDFGQAIKFNDLYAEFVQRGGVTTGLVRGVDRVFNDLQVPSEVWSFLRERGWAGSMEAMLPLATRNKVVAAAEGALFKVGQRAATASETVSRFAVFLDTWKKTGDFDQAIQMVQQIMYDYDKLLASERKILQRVFPFWSWLRNNIPFSMKYAALEPVKHMQLARAMGDMARGAGGWPDENEIPHYLQSMLLLPVFRKDGVLFASVQDNFLPVMDIVKLFGHKDGLFAGAGSVAADSLTPFVQTAIELVTNRSLFTGRQLSLAPGQPAASGTLSALGFTQTPTASGDLGIFNVVANQFLLKKIPAATQLLKFVDWATGQENFRGESGIPVAAAALDMLATSILTLDPVRARSINRIKERQLKSTYRSIYRWGAKTGRQDLVDFARKRMLELHISQEPDSK